MFVISVNVDGFSPPDHVVTLRTSVDDAFHIDLAGVYTDGWWKFELDQERYAADPSGAFETQVVLNYSTILDRFPVTPTPHSTYRHEYTEDDVQLGARHETGRVQGRYFPDLPHTGRVFDVIVIGSGMGGGVLADQLSNAGVSVLVLEAGGYLFPTHAANLPRRQLIGRLNKAFWQTWEDFSTYNYWNAPDSQYRGAQGFNLGGRSVFWGGLIPRMTSYEMDYWPREIKWYLEEAGYEKAESLVGRAVAPHTLYNRQVHNYLLETFPGFHHMDAPVALQTGFEGMNTIAPGMFSTADVLMESYLTASDKGNENLAVNLNHEVVAVRQAGTHVVVDARVLATGEVRSFTGRTAVLAAGTIESARLAHRSSFPDPHGLVGRGLTDHPIYWNHFKIPSESDFYNPAGNVKIMSQPSERESPREAEKYSQFNVQLELGSDFNQGRYMDLDLLEEHLHRRKGMMLGELVFLYHAALQDENHLEFRSGSDSRPTVHMSRYTPKDETLDLMRDYKTRMYKDLGIVEEVGSGVGDLGGVAHEVGTLRMRVDDSNRVEQARSPATEGMVDRDCRLIGLDNVYVCDLSIFPTSPAANPTLTLVALAIRLAAHLRADLQ